MHIGIIADGNGRWAERRGLPREKGHRVGADNVSTIASYLLDKTDYLSLYGFSTENWNRNPDEVQKLFDIMETCVNGRLLRWCEEHKVRLYHFGRRDRLPKKLLLGIDNAIAATRLATGRQTRLHVSLCLDYGYRDEVDREAVTTTEFPDVDLIIRTGGEHRLSNFLLYQSAYAEIFFTKVLFPDLKGKTLHRILEWYHTRTRKFGR